MVRTKRSIDEEQRVRLLDQPLADPLVLRGEWTQAFTGKLMDRVVKWGARPSKRVLVVGLEDKGDLAMRFLRKGMFVTVVDPDKTKIDALNQMADAEGVGLKLNAFADEYISRQFAISSFDLICMFSILSRYSEPFVVIRKAKRELKTAAQIFARFRTRPDIKIPDRVTIPGFVGRMAKKISDIAGLEDLILRLPTNAMVMEAMEKEFSVKETIATDTLALPLALAVGKLGLNLPVEKASGILNELETRIPGRFRYLAGGTLSVFATKEKELGSTFSVR